MAVNVYDYEVDLEGDSAPARVIRMCGRERKVLEVGAGPGSISRHLAKHNACDVVGADIDPGSVENLKKHCRVAYEINLNEPGWTDCIEQEGHFDVVVAADVLEHLSDPERVLSELKTLLNKDGCIILSIPHVGHSAVLACLANSNFSYGPYGLLDRTHVRFFGIENIDHLIATAGLRIEHAEFVVKTPEMTELLPAWDNITDESRRVFGSYKFGNVYQVVLKAVVATEGVSRRRLTDMEVVLPRNAPRPVKLIAFYLPQFHPIAENDEWWGKGFTEWTNVSKAAPLFKNHYQPHLPSDLGFYDLRLKDSRHAQVSMAKEFGIDGFCYYYYWFSGRRVLEKPLEDMLADPQTDMPFCLCWANENWTRRWDGQDQEVLLAQTYYDGFETDFAESILPFMRDPRYIQFNGRPILLVYNPQDLPDASHSAKLWRRYFVEQGLPEPYLVAALVHGNRHQRFDFDATVEFPPHNLQLRDYRADVDADHEIAGHIIDYQEAAADYLQNRYGGPGSLFEGFRTVVPSWDNTARRGLRANLLLNGTPENYEYWLSEAIRKTRLEVTTGDRFVFVNAWNEWAEGCHLEPDLRYGRRFLEATSRAKNLRSQVSGFPHSGIKLHAKPPPSFAERLEEWVRLHVRQGRWTLRRFLGLPNE